MRFTYIITVVLFLMLWGCDDTDKIEVREEGEQFFVLPQGNHDFDKTIVEWFDKYGFYTLYQWEDKDLYWNYSSWLNAGRKSDLDFWAFPADENYVSAQLSLIKTTLIDLYPEKLLKYMPLKLILCSTVWVPVNKTVYDPAEGWVTRTDSSQIATYRGYDCLAVTGGREETLSNKLKRELQRGIGVALLERFANTAQVVVPEEFAEISDYTPEWYDDPDYMFAEGFLSKWTVGGSYSLAEARKYDFVTYIMLVAYALEELESYPDYSKESANIPSWIGALHEYRDVNGLVRKKYEIAVNYLKACGVDVEQLQRPVFE